MAYWDFRAPLSETMVSALRHEPDAEGFLRAFGLLENQPEWALRELQLLADKGSALSMALIGNACIYGRGAHFDIELGRDWLIASATRGSIEGRFRLAALYHLQEDYAGMFVELRKLVDLGHSPAMAVMGFRYYDGDGVGRDLEEAVKYWSMAEKRGHLIARHQVLYFFRSGRYGLKSRIQGFVKAVALVKDLADYETYYPNSDRIRQWPLNFKYLR